jgi:2,4-diaminopentanoate dehydrogenase
VSKRDGDDLGVVVMGLGPMGLAALRTTLARREARLVAAVDLRDELVGRDAGELAGIGRLGVPVSPDLRAATSAGSADVVLLCTGSHLRDVADQVIECVAWGAAVVSSCEELAYPWFHHPDEARRLDQAAQDAGRAIIGTGVNPGFAMDALVLAVSGIVECVAGVTVHRVVDASTRRGPLQLKVGAGIDVEEFEARKAGGRIGHVGLVESAAMLGAGFGWPLDRIEESLDPVLAREDMSTDVAHVPAGAVAGIHQRVVAAAGDREVITLDLRMYVGAEDPGDTVRLHGDPPIVARLQGLHGDLATAAIIANAAFVAPRLGPGLRTMLDLLPLRAPAMRVDPVPAPFAELQPSDHASASLLKGGPEPG